MAADLQTAMEFIRTFRYMPGKLPLANLESVLGGITLYFVVVFGIQYFMKDRKKFELNSIVPIHNFFLSALSLIMMLGMAIPLTQLLIETISSQSPTKLPLTELYLCDPEARLARGPQAFWFYIFFLSKYYEFFDTVIIVLKKRPVIFLHVYHHCITVLLVFVMLENEVAVQWLASTANCSVHIPMYYYYAMSSLGKNVWWKKYITKMQIFQFVVDISANCIGFYYHLIGGKTCSGALPAWVFGQAVLISFLILFLFFYRSTYKKPSTPQNQPTPAGGEEVKKTK